MTKKKKKKIQNKSKIYEEHKHKGTHIERNLYIYQISKKLNSRRHRYTKKNFIGRQIGDANDRNKNIQQVKKKKKKI